MKAITYFVNGGWSATTRWADVRARPDPRHRARSRACRRGMTGTR